MKKRKLKELLAIERSKNSLLSEHLADALSKLNEEESYLPEIAEIQINGPFTKVTWDDGAVSEAHNGVGGKFDPLMGILVCAFKKLTSGTDAKLCDYERLLGALTCDIHDIDDVVRMYNDMLIFADILGVILVSEDKIMEHLGPAKSSADKLEQMLELSIKEQEAIRQRVRNLIDAGEL